MTEWQNALFLVLTWMTALGGEERKYKKRKNVNIKLNIYLKIKRVETF